MGRQPKQRAAGLELPPVRPRRKPDTYRNPDARTAQIATRVTPRLKAAWDEYLERKNAEQSSALMYLIADAVMHDRDLPVTA